MCVCVYVYGIMILWALMVGGWLFLLSNPRTYCFLLLVAFAEVE